jgi:hypothetical protein
LSRTTHLLTDLALATSWLLACRRARMMGGGGLDAWNGR